MVSINFIRTAALAALAILMVQPASAATTCEQLLDQSGSTADLATAGPPPVYQYGPMKVVFKGNTIKADFELTRREVRQLLAGWNADGINDKERITWVLQNMAYIDDFQGPAGLTYYVMLKLVEAHMLNGASLKPRLSIRPHGRITDNHSLLVRSDWSGHLQVTMCFDAANTKGQGQPILGYVRYTVRTDVSSCGFKIIPKTRDAQGKPVFEGSVVDLSDVKDLDDFNYKLQAQGTEAGTGDGDCTPGFPGNLYMQVGYIAIDDGDGQERAIWPAGPMDHFFDMTVDDKPCIDILTVDDPRQQINPDSRNPPYCLGRCTNPPLINSGL